MSSTGVKFIVTGPQRSGTSYLASILNGQDECLCLEDYPFIFSDFRNNREKNVYLSRLEAQFIAYGIEVPQLRGFCTPGEVFTGYCEHLKRCFGVRHIGFKSTMKDIQTLRSIEALGFKVIFTRRNTADLFWSYINRIDHNPERSAVTLKAYFSAINNYDFKGRLDDVRVLDFDRMMREVGYIDASLSDYLGFPIDPTKPRFHSYNRGRKEFEKNSSFGESPEGCLYHEPDMNRQNCERYVRYIKGGWDYGIFVRQQLPMLAATQLKKLLAR